MSFRKNFILQIKKGSIPPIPPKGGIYYISFEDDNRIYTIDSDSVITPQSSTFNLISEESNKVKINGDIEIETNGGGVIITSPNGTKYKLAVNNSGYLTTTKL